MRFPTCPKHDALDFRPDALLGLAQTHRRGEALLEMPHKTLLGLEKEKSGNVSIYWDNILDEVLGDDSGVNSIRIRNLKSGESNDVQCLRT